MSQNPTGEPQSQPFAPGYEAPSWGQPTAQFSTAGAGVPTNISQPQTGAVAQYGVSYSPVVQAPFGHDPVTGLPYSEKSKLVAGLLQIFLGGLGVGRFYLGNIGMAIAQIVVTVLTLGFGALWPLIDGIVLLAGSPRDRYGRPLRP